MIRPERFEIEDKRIYFTYWTSYKTWINEFAGDKLWHSIDHWQIAIGLENTLFRLYRKGDWWHFTKILQGFTIFGVTFLLAHTYQSEAL